MAFAVWCTMAITIQICTGPECGPLGSHEMIRRLRRLPVEKRRQLTITFQQCFARCQMPGTLCPCARVDGEWIVQADMAKVEAALEPHWQDESDDNDPFADYFP